MKHLYLDERYEKVRQAGQVRNSAQVLRVLAKPCLVTAVVMEISEDWQTGKRYIKWESDDKLCIDNTSGNTFYRKILVLSKALSNPSFLWADGAHQLDCMRG